MPISDDLKRVYSSAPTDKHYIETLELQHPIFREATTINPSSSLYLVNQVTPWDAALESGQTVTFTPAPFVVIPPNSQESSAIQLQCALDNSDRSVMDNLEHLANFPNIPIVVYYRVYLSDDATGPAKDPPLKLYVLTVTATDSTITFNAGLSNLRLKPFPSRTYNIQEFAGLAR